MTPQPHFQPVSEWGSGQLDLFWDEDNLIIQLVASWHFVCPYCSLDYYNVSVSDMYTMLLVCVVLGGGWNVFCPTSSCPFHYQLAGRLPAKRSKIFHLMPAPWPIAAPCLELHTLLGFTRICRLLAPRSLCPVRGLWEVLDFLVI